MDERTQEIVNESKAIILGIEAGDPPLSQVALRAKRLAQLLDDDVAVEWLSFESTGSSGAWTEMPSQQTAASQATIKWARLRFALDLSTLSHQQFVANLRDRGIPAAHIPTLMGSLAGLQRSLIEAGFDVDRLRPTPISRAHAQAFEGELRRAVERVAHAIHEWATGIYTTHRFRQLAGSIFDRLKSSSDATLASLCPSAIDKLNHAIERAGTDNPEAWSAAAMSCRRALKDFADAVYPPLEEPVDGRKVGQGEYKNRLWAFAKSHGTSAMDTEALSGEEIDGLCTSLDRVYDLDSKGVHDKVSKREADMLVLRTYILLAQLSALAGAPS